MRSEDECVYIDRTTDGGATWARQYTKCGYYGREGIYALHFVDQLHGWAFGVVNAKTTDGGQTWQPHNIQYGEWLKMLDLTHRFKITLGDVYPFCSTTIFTYKLFETRDAGADALLRGARVHGQHAVLLVQQRQRPRGQLRIGLLGHPGPHVRHPQVGNHASRVLRLSFRHVPTLLMPSMGVL